MKGYVRQKGSRWGYLIEVEVTPNNRRTHKVKGGFNSKEDAEKALKETMNKLSEGTNEK